MMVFALDTPRTVPLWINATTSVNVTLLLDNARILTKKMDLLAMMLILAPNSINVTLESAVDITQSFAKLANAKLLEFAMSLLDNANTPTSKMEPTVPMMIFAL